MGNMKFYKAEIFVYNINLNDKARIKSVQSKKQLNKSQFKHKPFAYCNLQK